MAEKLVKYYEQARAVGGLKAEMRLAILTLMPSAKAQAAPDSPENIQLFEKAMDEIRRGSK
jgi:hypothetical protein